MSLTSRIASFLSGSPSSPVQSEDRYPFALVSDDGVTSLSDERQGITSLGATSSTTSGHSTMTGLGIEEEARPPYLHAMLAGGLGGSTGDLLMHSIDTVKTRQQGDPHIPPKYTSMLSSYSTVFREEGIRRGLYGGWQPALMGSFPGTVIFFGTYEWSKRHMLDFGVKPQLAYLSAGFLADLAASIVYVPSEVLKTRLQLQGRFNNPHFNSGYNYRSLGDAVRTIVREEGVSALFYGYKATIWRDVPFSALQFAFYEQAQLWARRWKQSRDIGLPLELATGAGAGGLAGVLTCPLDVVKTRIQTQVNPTEPPKVPVKLGPGSVAAAIRTPIPGAVTLDTSSIYTGLKLIYKTEGVSGWFRGVGPRLVWTSVQSGCMLFLYQNILKQLEKAFPESAMEAESVL